MEEKIFTKEDVIDIIADTIYAYNDYNISYDQCTNDAIAIVEKVMKNRNIN